jgi:hypothetical protein
LDADENSSNRIKPNAHKSKAFKIIDKNSIRRT